MNLGNRMFAVLKVDKSVQLSRSLVLWPGVSIAAVTFILAATYRWLANLADIAMIVRDIVNAACIIRSASAITRAIPSVTKLSRQHYDSDNYGENVIVELPNHFGSQGHICFLARY